MFKLIGALTSKPYSFSARSWELESVSFVDFYDSLLSNISISLRGLSILRVLPRINENLNEEWISDKIRFSYDGYRRQRLVVPLFKSNEVNSNFLELSWKEAFFFFFYNWNYENYDFVSENSLDVVSGNFIDLESYASLKQMFNSFNSVKSYFYSQFLTFFDNTYFSNFFVNFDLKKLNASDLIFLAGSNLRYESPVLHLKLLRLSNQGVPVFTLGSPSNFKFKNYSLGNSLASVQKFLGGKNKYSLLFSKAKNPVGFFGESLFKRLDGKSLSQIFINNKFFKRFSFSHVSMNPSTLSSLSLNAFDNSLNLNLYSQYSNKFKKVLYLYNADEILLDKSKYSFIVYQGHHGDRGSSLSNLIFPSTFLIEKSGTFLSIDGRFSSYDFVIKPGYQVRTDWRIFKALSLFLGNNINVNYFKFLDLQVLVQIFLPDFLKKKFLTFKYFNSFSSNLFFEVNNSILYSNYIDYFLNDSVSRSSRIMAVAALRFKKFFYNF